MPCTHRVILALGALLALIAPAAHAGLRVTIEVPEGGFPETPLYVEVETPGGIPPGTPMLQAGAVRCWAQWESLPAGRARLWFFPPEELPAGMSVSLELRATRTKLPDNVLLEETDKGVAVSVYGEPLTTYDVTSVQRPICYPLLGPSGLGVTRNYPMGPDTEGEARDHPHHQSLWFGLDKVGGVDFWSIAPTAGSQKHREFLEVRSGPVFGKLVAATDWLAADGRKVCEDRRTLRFFACRDSRLFDYEVELRATEGDLLLGDTKEGLMSCRVATSLAADNGGVLVNSEGQSGGEAWGQPARWVDSSGPLGGETIGVAILDAPDSYGFPTHWHARTYGLVGANPFGLSQFLGAGHDGSYTVANGTATPFRYRWVLHRGDATAARIDELWTAWGAPPTSAETTGDERG